MNSVFASLRSDAQANRKKLLDSAREAFAVHPDASLNSIAKAAGVGVGTLYRHFRSREALIVAVNRAEVEKLMGLARELTRDHSSVEAFRLWCHRLIDHVMRQRGFRETLQAALSMADQELTYRPVREAIEHLLHACEAETGSRVPVDASDVQLLLSFIWQVRTEDGERRAHRVVEVILRGLALSGNKVVAHDAQPRASRTLEDHGATG